MANLVFDRAKFDVLKSAIDLTAATLKLMLLQSGTPVASNDFVTNLTPGTNEISVSGYARQSLTTKTVTEDTTNNFAYLSADNVVFTGLATGQTVTWAILFRFVTNDTDSTLIAAYDVVDTPTNGGNITITWNSAANGGVLKAA